MTMPEGPMHNRHDFRTAGTIHVIDGCRPATEWCWPMIPRLILLFVLLAGLALGPVRGSAVCRKMAVAGSCHACCADPAAACCAVACGEKPAPLPVPSAPTTDDGKQLVAPTLVVVGASPAFVLEQPAVHKRQAARRPAVPRLELICVRLI